MRSVEDYMAMNYRMELRRAEDGGYIARVQELPGCMADGETPAEAIEGLRDAMYTWIESRQDGGLPVPEPRGEDDYSGRFVVRMPKYLHARLAQEADLEGVSLNQYVVSLLSSSSANCSPAHQETNVFQVVQGGIAFRLAPQGVGWPALFGQALSSPALNVAAFPLYRVPAGLAFGKAHEVLRPASAALPADQPAADCMAAGSNGSALVA
jgi:predicted RNase H-like HicB family nuclease